MNTKRSDVVSASEIAAYAFCPESWRLDTLGAEPDNQAALDRGEAFHAGLSAFEIWSRRAVLLGRLLLVIAALAALLWYLLSGGEGQ